MKLLALICFLTLGSSAQAQIQLTPYIVSNKQILADSREIADGMVTNFAIANKANVKKFRYKEFDQSLARMHPVLAWATLRYLSDRSTGARQVHVHNYVGRSQVLHSLNTSFTQHPDSATGLEYFESEAPKGGFGKMSEKDFIKLIDKVIVVLKSKRA